MVPIAPVLLAVVITLLWSKDMLKQDASSGKPANRDSGKSKPKSSGKKLVVYLEDEEASA